MSRFIAKKVLFKITFLLLLIIFSITVRVYAATTPPGSTGIVVPPLPTYCEITNGGVEICDGLDNNCNGQIDDGITCSCINGAKQNATCGVGACYKKVAQTCTNGAWGPACTPGTPTTEICNGIDDDCNLLIDDGLSRGTSCGVGICAGNTGIETCILGNWSGNTCKPLAGAITEICNGFDDNCNGQIDDGITCNCINGATQACGSDIGECRVGSRTCTNGAWGTCVNEITPQNEACDGKDNNCNGQIDENWSTYSTRPVNFNQVGVCLGSKKQCTSGNWINWYDSTNIPNYQAVETLCDGLDNDCDGQIDEGCSCTNGATTNCGSNVGACKYGTSTCTNGVWGSCVGGITPANETCDSVDNNCNGVNNELLPTKNLNTSCSTGLYGVCSAGTRYQYCDASVSSYTWSACVQNNYPSVEICNGLDDNCDNLIDNNLNAPSRPCSVSVGACQRSGTEYQTCNNFQGWSLTYSGCTAVAGSPTPEVCDAVDNNCDGVINDNLPNINVNTSCSTGLYGVCSAGTRYQYCNASVSAYTWSPCVPNVNSSTEICDGLDNNCDGVVDEGCSCINGATKNCGSNVGACKYGTSICTNGVWGSCVGGIAPTNEICDGLDNDCDGVVNDGLPNINLNSSCTTGLSGVCSAGTNYQYCDASVSTYTWTQCVQNVKPSPEVCDGLDNDCDGVINNGLSYININTQCNTGLAGVCAAGIKYMFCGASETSYKWSDCTQKANSSNETCDGIDNDCDGTVDEGCGCAFGSNQSCGSNIGICKSGIQNCVDGTWSATCIGEIPAQTEICDALDNNCNGVINDGLPALNESTDCSTGLLGVCASGTKYRYCDASVSSYTWTNCTPTANPSSEICDGLDNNCNGVIDENACHSSGGSSSSGGFSDAIGGSNPVIPDSNAVTDIPVANSGTNDALTNPNVESPQGSNSSDNYNATAAPVLANVKDFSKANRLLIILGIMVVIAGVLTFVVIEQRREKKEEIVPSNISNNLTVGMNTQRLGEGQINRGLGQVNNYGGTTRVANYGNNNYGINNFRNNATNINTLANQYTPAINYVFAMRQKGFKDDVIMNNLRSKGWNEDLLRRIFK